MDFKRSMFWLAVISGGLILLHGLLLLILKLRDYTSEKRRYGALVFPRFKIFLLMLSVPCICKASVSIIKGIFVGRGKVVHFTPRLNSNIISSCSSSTQADLCPNNISDCGFRNPNSGVVLSCLDCFLGNGSLYLLSLSSQTHRRR